MPEEGKPPVLGARKPLALLGIVAVSEPTGISRDQLQLLLWPESSPERARQSISQSLYALRQEFGVTPTTGSAVITLTAGVTSDVARFRVAVEADDVETALTIASRPFFDGVSFPGCVELDQFVDRTRAELERSLVSAMGRSARSSSGSDAATVARWTRYADRCIHDSSAVREAAEAIAQRGNRAVALQLLLKHGKALEREMGVGVDGATRRLMATLQRDSGEIALAVPAAAAPSREAAPDHRSRISPATPTLAPAQSERSDYAPPVPRTRPQRRRRAAGLLLALGLGVFLVVPGRLRGRRPDAPPNASLLVAPFTYRGDSSWRYLGRGIAEEIAARLAPMPGAQIYGPSAVHADDPLSARQVGERLNARYVLEGSILAEPRGDTVGVRVTTSLLNTADGRVMWSWTSDRRLDGMLQLQTSIADSAAQEIALTFSDGGRRAMPRLPTVNPAAYDYYLRAREYLRRGRDGLPEARALLGQAIALDSNFAAALARYAETQARMNWYGYDRSPAAMREAQRLIDRSRQFASARAEPYIARAWWLLADHRGYRDAAAQLDSALAISPRDSDALMTRANINRRSGDWPRAADDYREAARLDPSSYAVSLEFGNTLLLMRRFDEARTALEQAQALSPDAVDPPVWLAALMVRERGDTAAARRILQEALPRVNAHYLVARVTQSFPELLRLLPPETWPRVSEFSLRDAYGDTALMYALRSSRERDPRERQTELDSAATVLRRRLAGEATAFAAHRALAEVLMAQGKPAEALASARRSAELMPADADAYSAVHSQVVLAEAELRSGLRDSARARVQRLLNVPSSLSMAVVAIDPLWKPLGLGARR